LSPKAIKTTFVMLFIFLFLFIINQFFRENKLLLEERNSWQEKAILYAEQVDSLKQNDGRPAANGTDTVLPAVSIQEVKTAALTFSPGSEDRLNYSISLTLANKSSGRTLPVACLLYFVSLTPEGDVSRTTPRVINIPALAAGERKELLLNGGIDLEPGEELVLYIDIPANSTGPVKKSVTLFETFD